MTDTTPTTPPPPDDGHLDGCAIDFRDDPTPDDELAPLAMFADVRGDADAIETRRVELVEWAAALGSS
jgi:hypothetical protein